MWVFQHKELTALFSLSVILFVPYYFILKSNRFHISSSRSVFAFFLGWLAVYTVEYFIFGPNSFIATDTDSRNITFLYYLARIHPGGQFAHEIAGGQDLSVILPGTQYLVPEKLLLGFLDSWIVVWLHKLMIGTLAFFGAYLLARGISDRVGRFAAVAAASVFPVSHIYLGNYSIEFGTGFAAVPFAVYAAVVCVNRKHFLAWVLGAGLILALAQPMKVFPAALVAVACVLVLYDQRNIGKTATAFLIYVLLVVVNWHEVLYGMAVLVDQTARGFGSRQDVADISLTLSRLMGRVYQNWVVSGLFVVSVVVLVSRRDRLGFAALGSLALFAAAFMGAELFPWQSIGLSFINRVEHAYMFLALPVVVVPVAAMAIAADGSLESRVGGQSKNRPAAAALLALALCLLTWNKLLNGAWFIALGGQNSSFSLAELKNPNWKTEKNVRVISLFEIPPTNIAATYYGLDSFDGASLLNPKPWNDYWASVKNLPLPSKRVATRASLDWNHWDGKIYAISDELRLDLLRIANVKYIISPLPLAADGLTPIVSADRGQWAKTRPGFFAGRSEYFMSRLDRIFDPGALFIYAMADTLPRIFAVAGLEIVADGIDTAALHERVAAAAAARRAVVTRKSARKLNYTGMLDVVSFDKAPDGYDVNVRTPDGGVLVVNNTYLPYWRATAGGRELDIVPANGIHMAVAVPPGASEVKIRYRRPLLRDRLAAFFN